MKQYNKKNPRKTTFSEKKDYLLTSDLADIINRHAKIGLTYKAVSSLVSPSPLKPKTDMFGNPIPTYRIKETDFYGNEKYLNTDSGGNIKYETIDIDGYPSTITIKKDSKNRVRLIKSRKN